MGQEIQHAHFSAHDVQMFDHRLREETALLARWVAEARFPDLPLMGGLELESWLVDRDGAPAPLNHEFLALADDPLVVPELARFNIELNSEPCLLTGPALSHMARDLELRWRHCRDTAARLDADVVMIGILPTARQAQFTLDYISDSARYRALNEQIFRSRHDRPLRLQIEGRDRLDITHHDVMLEAAATSFQVHLRVPPQRAAAFYDAALAASPLMTAVCANAPYLFGRDQAVASPPRPECASLRGRVTFGDGFAAGDPLACFRQNQTCFAPLLPMEMDKYPASLSHLRLHNGAIWRWNRPLVGFEADGRPHFRIEHRTASAGPTAADCIANAALFYGLSLVLVDEYGDLSARMDFTKLREDFYAAARLGLTAQMRWLDGRRRGLAPLLLEHLLPRCAAALRRLGLDAEDVAHYLGIIERRVATGMTGSQWQRSMYARLDGDMNALLQAYREQERSGRPVHEWEINAPQMHGRDIG